MSTSIINQEESGFHASDAKESDHLDLDNNQVQLEVNKSVNLGCGFHSVEAFLCRGGLLQNLLLHYFIGIMLWGM